MVFSHLFFFVPCLDDDDANDNYAADNDGEYGDDDDYDDEDSGDAAEEDGDDDIYQDEDVGDGLFSDLVEDDGDGLQLGFSQWGNLGTQM